MRREVHVPVAAARLADRHHFGDLLDVDDQTRRLGPAAHLHQQVGAAGKYSAAAVGAGHQAARLLERLGCGVTDFCHWWIPG